MKTYITVIGDRETGKTTLINALLGWDVLPQGGNGYEFPTRELTEAPGAALSGFVFLDTPGYDFITGFLPGDTEKAIGLCDILIILLSEELTEKEVHPGDLDPEWNRRRQREADFLKKILQKQGDKDVLFVVPYDADDWCEGTFSPEQAVRIAADRFYPLTPRGTAGFFCVDALKALTGAIEDDRHALASSGILPLHCALRQRDRL